MLRATEDERQRVQVFAALARAIVEYQGDAPIRCNLAHGDFTPWNSLVAQGEVRAYDWEQTQRLAPALYDLVHFHVQTGVLVGHHPGERVFDELERLFSGPGSRLVNALGLERDDVLRLVALYVLSMGVSSEVLERLRPAPFAQAGWLRRARLALCRRLAGLLKDRRLPSWTQQSGRRAA